MKQQFDFIVIGAGPGGYEIAARSAAQGQRVAVVEKNLAGGTCLNRGCIPTKCLCASAQLVDSLAAAAEFGVDIKDFTSSYAKAHERMVGVVDNLRAGVELQLKGCTVFVGEARFDSDGNVCVGDDVLTAPRTLIATGSRPATLPITGADLAMTSDDFLKLDTLPHTLIIIGGGVIGIELAAIALSFGCQVTVVEYCKEILPPFDSEVAKRLRTMLARRGVTFILGSAVTSIVDDGGSRIVKYEGKRGVDTVAAQAVLMAVGRRPVVPGGLADAGIEVSPKGAIVVDDTFRTTRHGVYAVGDCIGGMMLAHVATAQAMTVAGQHINLKAVPACVFASPEVAMVGITGDAAKLHGDKYIARKALFAANGKACASGHADGFVKVIYDAETRRLVGCHIIGPHASDLIHEAAAAIANDLTIDQLAATIHAHPSLAETLRAALPA